ncbi:MAG TPA: DoxX family membrane protein [Puia sp.]|uniref:DoxX family membrane protein n=1 Tax=Puia sp. TaxID=2045100 RepID=UPI002CBB350F|nr:DoxX family membrane protein [Puia sp.]HVU94658.1 DoxX family membrane protein [Puia sp.]
MTTLQQIRDWGATHHPRWLVIVRVGLGLFLFAKGITFMHNATLLDRLIYGGASLAENQTHWLPILITWANLLTGTLLIIGCWTRAMALLQIPILIGAIIFNAQRGVFAPESELILAILTLLLVLFFLVEGGGPLSLDGYFEKNKGRGSHGDILP